MQADNKETVFQFLSAVVIIVGIFLKESIIIIGSIIPILLSIWFWYHDNISLPIKNLEKEVKELRKDLNIRKEIEDIRISMSELKNALNKK